MKHGWNMLSSKGNKNKVHIDHIGLWPPHCNPPYQDLHFLPFRFLPASLAILQPPLQYNNWFELCSLLPEPLDNQHVAGQLLARIACSVCHALVVFDIWCLGWLSISEHPALWKVDPPPTPKTFACRYKSWERLHTSRQQAHCDNSGAAQVHSSPPARLSAKPINSV